MQDCDIFKISTDMEVSPQEGGRGLRSPLLPVVVWLCGVDVLRVVQGRVQRKDGQHLQTCCCSGMCE